MPAPLRQLQDDLEKNLRSVLQGAFARMNLVTREEFDVQTAVLARSREMLSALEKRVEEMEASADQTRGVSARIVARLQLACSLATEVLVVTQRNLSLGAIPLQHRDVRIPAPASRSRRRPDSSMMSCTRCSRR